MPEGLPWGLVLESLPLDAWPLRNDERAGGSVTAAAVCEETGFFRDCVFFAAGAWARREAVAGAEDCGGASSATDETEASEAGTWKTFLHFEHLRLVPGVKDEMSNLAPQEGQVKICTERLLTPRGNTPNTHPPPRAASK